MPPSSAQRRLIANVEGALAPHAPKDLTSRGVDTPLYGGGQGSMFLSDKHALQIGARSNPQLWIPNIRKDMR